MSDDKGEDIIPYEQDSDGTMRDIADYANRELGGKYGFSIIVFPTGEDSNVGTANYISNCQRVDMIRCLREKADELEKNMDIPLVPPKYGGTHDA